MGRAAQKGEGAASPEVAKVAGEISKKDAKDFAKTKHKGLPEKKKQQESFEIDPQKHRKAKRDAKIRNLAKDNKNPNEKEAAERKLKGPKLAWEEFKSKIILDEAFASRAEAEKHYGSDPDYTFNNAGSTANPKWRRVKKENRKKQANERKKRLTPGNLASKEESAKGERKKKAIQKKGMEAHHITPTHASQKARGKMSDAEWKKKKESDAKGHGIYHGDHPRNLAATTGPKTPKGRKGIPHRAKGYHEAEGEERKSKDSGPVVGTSRDIISTRKRKESRERKRKELGRD